MFKLFIRYLRKSGREKVGLEHGTLRLRLRVLTTTLHELVMVVCVEFLNTSYLVTILFITRSGAVVISIWLNLVGQY